MLRSVWYKIALIALLATMPMASWGNDVEKPQKEKKRVFSGFSGGMLVHLGYGFAHNPSELFRNGTLATENLKNLPKDGVFLGIGGQMRIHLIDHFRVGGEGYVSTMPLKSVGQVRSGWGGVLADAYLNWGPVQPFIGLGLGGGSMRRTYVNENIEATVEGDETKYNASFTKTPFFYLDPKLGLEFGITPRINIIIQLDYVLPFSVKEQGIRANIEQMKDWKGLMTPTGPRLYVGFMFKH